ncbi:interleukin-6 receptor subunit beta [Cololabis saira]|uniref:interleukin-6 receptor subunit beta n=1 Tax=Cololabis saira TaxID=129043 RepID=UPI002AD1EA58|nr:interleukin-6 receptor subunit beta [Cololabis saira]
MGLTPAVVWICLLGAGLAQVQPSATSVTPSETPPRPPTIIGCVFRIKSNVTCSWDPGDITAKNYTLQVQMMPSGIDYSKTSSAVKTFTCTTSGTGCTAGLHGSTVRINFCISVTAHTGIQNISSPVRCQSGRIEVILPPGALKSVQSVQDSPNCLNLVWGRNVSAFPVSDSEIQAGHLNSQIQYTTHEQHAPLEVHVSNVTVTGYSILVCLFRPDTTYIIRLRHRYQGPASPWSPWSNPVQGRTAEDAPSVPPVLWRKVMHTNITGGRLISLLWKPLPRLLANGRVLYYNVTCRTKSAQPLSDHGSCRDLHHPSFSCNLLLPDGYCSCSLTASTFAGTSPAARIWLRGTSETGLPAPDLITATPMNDSSLEVRWTFPPNPSVSGFVVEWFAVREEPGSVFHWEKLNSSCRKLIITEGVKPMERFAVSVKTLYGDRGAGKNKTLRAYTRQGAPSAGPHVRVQHISGSTVELSWTPVPVELLHGFLCNYTLFYKTRNQSARSVLVPAHVHHYTLEDLSPGNHDISMQANTVAGPGPVGNQIKVHIGSDEVSIVTCVAIPLILTSLVLMPMICLIQMKRMKQKLQQVVPNPSKSSISNWNPETSFETMRPLVVQEKPEINTCELILADEQLDLKQSHRCRSICSLLTYSSHGPTQLPVGSSGKESPRTSTEAEATPDGDFCSNPCIYSSILLSQTPPNDPSPLQPHCTRQSTELQPSTISINDLPLPPGELSYSYEFPDEKKTRSVFLKQHQSHVSALDFSNASRSSLSLLTEVGKYNMMLSLQPKTVISPDVLSDGLKASFSPFHHPVFVDLSYLNVQYDPSTSSDV